MSTPETTGISAWKNLPDDHEYEWDRIKRMREESHPLTLGGQYKPTPDFNDTNTRSQVKRIKKGSEIGSK